MSGLNAELSRINVSNAQGHNAVLSARLEPATPGSRVKHATTDRATALQQNHTRDFSCTPNKDICRESFLAHQIRISDILSWVRNSYFERTVYWLHI